MGKQLPRLALALCLLAVTLAGCASQSPQSEGISRVQLAEFRAPAGGKTALASLVADSDDAAQWVLESDQPGARICVEALGVAPNCATATSANQRYAGRLDVPGTKPRLTVQCPDAVACTTKVAFVPKDLQTANLGMDTMRLEGEAFVRTGDSCILDSDGEAINVIDEPGASGRKSWGPVPQTAYLPNPESWVEYATYVPGTAALKNAWIYPSGLGPQSGTMVIQAREGSKIVGEATVDLALVIGRTAVSFTKTTTLTPGDHTLRVTYAGPTGTNLRLDNIVMTDGTNIEAENWSLASQTCTWDKDHQVTAAFDHLGPLGARVAYFPRQGAWTEYTFTNEVPVRPVAIQAYQGSLLQEGNIVLVQMKVDGRDVGLARAQFADDGTLPYLIPVAAYETIRPGTHTVRIVADSHPEWVDLRLDAVIFAPSLT